MKILMMTNTYKPILGGLEKSVELLFTELRKRGHRVLIVAPEYDGAEKEKNVLRVPAISYTKDETLTVQLPIPGALAKKLGKFRPDIVHAHHPFFLGDTAIRLAYKHNIPLVFTHHSLYEKNAHYLSDTEAMRRFVIELSTGYANLADHVFAPSESVMNMISEYGVRTPISVVPTGTPVKRYAKGNGTKIKSDLGIPADAIVVGHIGRLALEKNLEFLSKGVALFMTKEPRARFLVVGDGPSEEAMREIFRKKNLEFRLHLAGRLVGQKLIDAYHAIDVFAFASQSETQGLVLVEAMAAGTPVVAVDAPGVREVVRDKVNGRLIPKETLKGFTEALRWMTARPEGELKKMRSECMKTAGEFSVDQCVQKALDVYVSLKPAGLKSREGKNTERWNQTLRMVKAQWDLTKNMAKGAGAMLAGEPVAK